MTHTTYLTDLQVAERLSVSRATLWRWAAMGRFPKPIRLSPGCSRWRFADIAAWEKSLDS